MIFVAPNSHGDPRAIGCGNEKSVGTGTHLIRGTEVTTHAVELIFQPLVLDVGLDAQVVEQVDRACFDQRKMRRVIDNRSATPYG